MTARGWWPWRRGAEDDGYAGWLVERSLPDGALRFERRLGPWGYRIALSPAADLVLVGDLRGGLALQSLEDGAVRWAAPDDPERRAITAVELSADGRTVRAGANLGTGPFGSTVLLTYRTDDPAGTPPEMLSIDADRIAAIATTLDGERLIIAASDAQAWADGRLLVARIGEDRTSGSLGPPGDGYAVLRVDPAGELLSGGPLSGWFAWTLDPVEWERRACAIAARDLTAGRVAGRTGRRALGPDLCRGRRPQPDSSPGRESSPGPLLSRTRVLPRARLLPRGSASPATSAPGRAATPAPGPDASIRP